MSNNEIKNWIVIPVYNDWESLQLLLTRIRDRMNDAGLAFNILVVNDGSTEQIPLHGFEHLPFECIYLRRNVGHQRAIAIGLSYLNSKEEDIEKVVIMDADGEDNPDSILLLAMAAEANPGKIVFSSRTHRQENTLFKISYFFYKIIFRILTGAKISFGNFSLIPGSHLPIVVNLSEIWNHYSGGVMKAGMEFVTIPVARAKRFRGKSRMNFISLVLHGLRSMAVYLDKISVRLLIFFIFIIFLLGLGMVVVFYFKYFTDLAIPGWATSAMSGLIILLFQALLISLFIIFIVLNQNNQRQLIPAIDYKDYIATVTRIPDEK